MHEQSNRRGRLFTVESIAGWVFADLLLVLFIVGLGSAMAYTPPEPPPPPPKVAPIVGMKTEPKAIQVTVNGGELGTGRNLNAQERKAVCRTIAGPLKSLNKQRAALVLVFGGAADVTTGQNVARAVARELHCAAPKVFPSGIPTRPFWDGTLPLGEVRLEVFLFVTRDAKN